jgi:N-methylhydantoinase A
VSGPVAYRRGGTEPTVTDSDLIVGYINPDFFLGGEMELSLADVEQALSARLAKPLGLDTKAVAVGIQQIVTESMAAATRMHLAEKGRDPRLYTLMAFGGAGPVHAYALAKLLKLHRVIVPMGAGVISAFGFLVAAPTIDDARGYASSLSRVDWGRVRALYGDMESRARTLLLKAGGADAQILMKRSADMRYVGQGFEVEVELPEGALAGGLEAAIGHAFDQAYAARFGRSIGDLPIEIINWRISARLPGRDISLAYSLADTPALRGERHVYFAGWGERLAAVYDRYALKPGTRIQGPAVFEERESSFSVGPDCSVEVDAQLNLIAEIAAPSRRD